MRRDAIAWLLVGGSIGLACTPPPSPAPDKAIHPLPPITAGVFARAEDTRLTLGGRPIRVFGVNASLLHGAGVRAAADDTIDAMGRDHVQVARVWALGEQDGDAAWMRDVAFRTGPDRWVEESFVHLDEVLVRARRRGVRVILVLANRWGNRGGFVQYARWDGVTPRGAHLMPAELRHVLTSETARLRYREHLERLVGRVNSINGVAYRDDPTIFAWELVNELSAPTCEVGRAQVAWTDEMSRRIRALDPNHLIAAGSIGYNSESSRRFWREVHALPEIGYADTHAYPQNLLLIDSEARLGAWLDDRAAEARAIGRPLVVGEVGVPRLDARYPDRAAWLGAFLAAAERDGTDGVLLWMFRPWDGREDPHGIYYAGELAEETASVRRVIFDAVKRGAAHEPDEATRPAGEVPIGIETIAPFVLGEWAEGRLEVDPWAIAEGCGDDDDAWVTYVIPWDPATRRVEAHLEGATELLVSLDGAPIGSIEGGRFVPVPAAVLPAGEYATLRLDARGPEGARALARFTRALPAEARIELRRGALRR
ncbi:MAG: cellulase family glycosylhydrolase [Sandaracinaceae bacterium]